MRIHTLAAPLLALAAMFSAGTVQAAACTSTTVLHAATDGVVSADGLGWATATTLQGALAAANGNTTAGQCYEIRVKQGVYKPVVPVNPTTVTVPERSISFAITRPLQLKGGYTGNSDTDRVLNARNTVLSGDIDGDDTGASTNGGITANASDIQGSNSYHVLTVGGTDTTSVGGPYTADATDASFTLVEGFSVTGGWANGSFPHYYGGGLYCNGRGTGSGPGCSPSISNATFSGNSASYGGAIYNAGIFGASSPAITNTTFSGNSARYNGGAIFSNGDISTSSPTPTSPTITNTTFSGNSALYNGGAIYNNGYSGTTITNTTFSGNSAGNSGGVIYNNGTSNITITASILWNNFLTGTRGSGPEVYNVSATATPTVKQSITQVYRAPPGTGNLNTNPLLGRLQNNGGPTFTMLPGAGKSAIDAVACNTIVTQDQRGVARPQGDKCDIGAVERHVGTNTLTIAVEGNGTVRGGLGTCASTSSSCSAPYGDGDPLTATLSATPATGSTFTGWGGACSGTASCVVTMDAARSVTANFALNTYAITTTANPAAGGSVSCADSSVAHGSGTTCTATTQAGFTLGGFTGCDSVSGNVCTLSNVTAARSVVANFAAVTSFSDTTVPSAGGTSGPASASFTGGGANCHFDDSTSTAFVPAPATLPAGQTMPHGMFQFKLLGCDTSPVTMSITWPAAVQGLSKWGKATAGAASTHFAPNGLNVIGNTTSFTVQDGQKGDDDWAVNGEIVDPVGGTVPVAAAAINPTPVPTLGQWALVLLSLMAAALGAGTLRRRVGNHS